MNIAAAVLAAVLTAGPAAHTPPPPSIITTHGGQCLTATGAATFAPVVLTPCQRPASAAQQWVQGRTGRFRLAGTGLYLNAGSNAAYLSAWHQAPVWVYVNLRLAADGQWLTYCASAGTGQPWLQGRWAPGCQNWRVVTPAG